MAFSDVVPKHHISQIFQENTPDNDLKTSEINYWLQDHQNECM